MNLIQDIKGHSFIELTMWLGLISLIGIGAVQSSRSFLRASKRQLLMREFATLVEHQLALAQIEGSIRTAVFHLDKNELSMEGQVLMRFGNQLASARFGNVYLNQTRSISFYPNYSVSPGSIILEPERCAVIVSQRGAIRSTC